VRGRRLPEALRQMVAARGEIVIRRAGDRDCGRLSELAELTGRPRLPDPVLLAEADGRLVAAMSPATGASLSDPFVPSADVVELLRLRANQLDAAA